MYTQLQPVLYIKTLMAEKEFYQKLGFTVSYDEPEFAVMAYEDSILFGLQVREQFDPAQVEQQLLWQIGTRSVGSVYKVCERENLEVVQRPTLQDWGEWTLVVKSPNGYRVIFEGPLD